ncbi:MAG: hypothetical protein ABIB97_05540 [Patescibacteria group bacterium]
MALVKKEISTKRIIRLVIIFAVVGIAGWLFIYITSSDTIDTNILTNVSQNSGDLQIVTSTGHDLLESDDFLNLRQHGQLPVKKGNVGKLNPFTAFIK